MSNRKFLGSFSSSQPFSIFLISVLFSFSLILISCQQGNPGTSNWFKNQNGQGSAGQDGMNGSSSGQGEKYNPAANAISSELQRCDRLRGISGEITMACGPAIQGNSGEFESEERGCVRAFNKLYDWECSRVENNIRSALSSCNPVINKYKSYMPSQCVQVINKFSKTS